MLIPYYTLLVLGLLGLLSFLFWPWFQPTELSAWRSSKEGLDIYQSLIQNRISIIENLKDLELDLQMQKIEQQDYEDLKIKLMGEAAQTAQAMKNTEKQDPFLSKVFSELSELKKGGA